jgi:hypothetical protein
MGTFSKSVRLMADRSSGGQQAGPAPGHTLGGQLLQPFDRKNDIDFQVRVIVWKLQLMDDQILVPRI